MRTWRLLGLISLLTVGGINDALAVRGMDVDADRLAWAERVIREATFEESKQLTGGVPNEALHDVLAAFERWTLEHPDNAAASTQLGRVQMLLGRYADALGRFQTSLRLAPNDANARRGEARATNRLAAIATIRRFLPMTGDVLYVEPLRIGAKSGWLAVTGAKKPAHLYYFDTYTSLRLHWVTGAGEARRLEWQSDILRTPELDMSEYNGIKVAVTDVTRDGEPEIMALRTLIGASWLPSQLSVLQWRGGRMRSILEAFSSMPHSGRDLDGNGTVEFLAEDEIGVEPPHVAQPRWHDVYAYDGNRYVVANKRFPGRFRAWPRTLESVIKEYPRDWELWEHLGMTWEILRNRLKASEAYRKAAAYCDEPKAKSTIAALQSAIKRGGDCDRIRDAWVHKRRRY